MNLDYLQMRLNPQFEALSLVAFLGVGNNKSIFISYPQIYFTFENSLYTSHTVLNELFQQLLPPALSYLFNY